jgi:hypothetical protein
MSGDISGEETPASGSGFIAPGLMPGTDEVAVTAAKSWFVLKKILI